MLIDYCGVRRFNCDDYTELIKAFWDPNVETCPEIVLEYGVVDPLFNAVKVALIRG